MTVDPSLLETDAAHPYLITVRVIVTSVNCCRKQTTAHCLRKLQTVMVDNKIKRGSISV